MKNIFFLVLLVFSFHAKLFAEDSLQVYPSHWWVGMKEQKVQLMIHAKNIGNHIPLMKLTAAGLSLAQGVTLKGMHAAENSNYFFLDD